ncbi:MAG: PQQ-dependent sugar dehydrogenase [bacterium]
MPPRSPVLVSEAAAVRSPTRPCRRGVAGAIARASLALLVACAAACSSGSAQPANGNTCGGQPSVRGEPPLGLERVATGFHDPVDFHALPGSPDLTVLLQRGGTIALLENGEPRAEPFGDLSAAITRNADSGLLALAFHPRFPRDPRVFVRYSIDHPLQTVLDELRTLPGDPTRLDSSSARRLVAIGRDTLGHDGGSLAFGPDGMLYLGVGDGGPLGDPAGKAQDPRKLSGKILRIDVDHGDPFGIPADNPFVGVDGARAEIWALGLRNPWRLSFDRATGDLWIADVGEDTREEIDRVAAGDPGGQNFGWNRFEGTHCFDVEAGCDATGLVPPVLEYEHVEPGGAPPGGPCAVVGGFAYRGCAMPDLAGTYFYGDFCAGFVRGFRLGADGVTDEQDFSPIFREQGLDSVAAFGEDARGEIYVLDYVDGDVFRIVPVPD